mgnify:CR=1 FL=1
MRGILFKPDMIKAIREGRKTVIRRVIKASNSTVNGYCCSEKSAIWKGLVWDERVFVDHGPHVLHPYPSQYLHVPFVEPNGENDDRVFRVRSRLEVGEVVYIKEAHYRSGHWNKNGLTKSGKQKWIFKANNNEIRYLDNPPTENVHKLSEKTATGWLKRSPLFMPEWAARYFIKITDVRAERLQEITESDAEAEGLNPADCTDNNYLDYPAVKMFATLWDSINPKYSWASNPWVFRYSFVRVGNRC